MASEHPRSILGTPYGITTEVASARPLSILIFWGDHLKMGPGGCPGWQWGRCLPPTWETSGALFSSRVTFLWDARGYGDVWGRGARGEAAGRVGAGTRLLFWDAGSGGQSGDKDIPLVASQPCQGGDLGDFQPGLVMLSRVGFELATCQHLTHSGSRKNEAGHWDLCHWVSARGVPGSAREEVWGGGCHMGTPRPRGPMGRRTRCRGRH